MTNLIKVSGHLPPTDLDWLMRWVFPEPNSGCWLWGGTLNPGGYGTVGFHGRPVNAHRVAWLLTGREIPEGYDIDHKCRVRCCVNPAHLEPVTRSENVLRGLRPGQLAVRNIDIAFCPKGHAYTKQNTYFDRRGYRDCIACRRERTRAWRRENSKRGNAE